MNIVTKGLSTVSKLITKGFGPAGLTGIFKIRGLKISQIKKKNGMTISDIAKIRGIE